MNTRGCLGNAWFAVLGLLFTGFLSATPAGSALAADFPRFTKKPAVTKKGAGAVVTFTVDRETDAAVFVEDVGGRIVRHLVAGVLGTNAPAPFKCGSLEQSVEWDGLADYKRPAAGGPFQVRVALGLGAKYDKVLLSDPNTLAGVSSLAVGPGGKVYVMHGTGGAVWGNVVLRAFNRDGTYSHTVMPFPASLTPGQAGAFGGFAVHGRAAPLVQSERLQLYRFVGGPRKHKMTVTPDGVILNWCGNHMLAVGTNGAAPWTSHEGPVLPGGARDRAFVVSAADGKSAYLGGMNKLQTAVYRIKLPERTPAEVFFGDPATTGSDETHLGATGAVGAALDGKGSLLISDPSNNRVVVVGEKDGKFVGSFPAAGVDGIAVDPASGAIYALLASRGDRADLVKFDGWKSGKEVARLQLSNLGNPEFPPVIGLDASAAPAVVWVGTDGGRLIRVEDAGDKFAAKEIGNNTMGTAAFLDVTVDRFRPDREIYTRCGTGKTWWWRFNEASNTFDQVRIPNGSGGGTGVNLVPAPDGCLYGLQWPMRFLRFDRTGSPLAWAQPDWRPFKSDGFDGKYPANVSYVPVSEGEMPHTLGVRGSDGHLFVMEPANPGGRPPKKVREYLPTGKLVSEDPVIWKVSDGAVGPRFDAAGNIYVADIAKPMGWAYPAEFDAAFSNRMTFGLRPSGAQAATANMYGSIIKFSAKGGIIDYRSGSDKAGDVVHAPYKGDARLDPTLKSMDVAWYDSVTMRGPERLIGAEWIHPGVSHIGVYSCTCENITFDVDEFGRVFFPDVNLFRVQVVDTAGNDMLTIGGYGNADSCGPEIGFAWLVGVGATDKYVYCGDSINRRLLRVKLAYAAEECAEIK